MRVCIYLPAVYPAGSPDGLGPHCTVVYSDTATGEPDAFCRVVEALAAGAPSSAQATGVVETFGADEPVPVAVLDASALAAWRSALLAALASAGCSAPSTWPDYRPHITLAQPAEAVEPEVVALGPPVLLITADDGAETRSELGPRLMTIADLIDVVTLAEDGRGRPFIAITEGPNTSIRDGQPITEVVTRAHLVEMARVFALELAAGTYAPRLDWRHGTSPYVAGGVAARSPETGFAMGRVTAVEVIDTPQGAALRITPRFNNGGLEIVRRHMTPDGLDSDLRPSAEFLTGPYYSRNGGDQIGTAALLAVGIQPRQQQDDARVSPVMLAEQLPEGGKEASPMEALQGLLAAAGISAEDSQMVVDAYNSTEGDDAAKLAAAGAVLASCIQAVKDAAAGPSTLAMAEPPAEVAPPAEVPQPEPEKPAAELAAMAALAERVQRMERAELDRAFKASRLAPKHRPIFDTLMNAGQVQVLAEFIGENAITPQPERAVVPVNALAERGQGCKFGGVDWGAAMGKANETGQSLSAIVMQQHRGV